LGLRVEVEPTKAQAGLSELSRPDQGPERAGSPALLRWHLRSRC